MSALIVVSVEGPHFFRSPEKRFRHDSCQAVSLDHHFKIICPLSSLHLEYNQAPVTEDRGGTRA